MLGEIGARDAAAIEALAAAVARGIPPVQRHALDALGRLASGAGVRRAMPAVLFGLAARDEAVRRAAVDAAIGMGDETIAPVRARLAAATDPLERRALEEVLGRVGGKDAFKALLAALDTLDVEAARAAALAVRQQVKEASAREKAAYLAEITKMLKLRVGKTRSARKNPRAVEALGLVSGGLKILGYLEDPAAVPTLLAFARDDDQPAAVREEAIVALRFTARGKTAPVAATLCGDRRARAARAGARRALLARQSRAPRGDRAQAAQDRARPRAGAGALGHRAAGRRSRARRGPTAWPPCCRRRPIAGAPRRRPRRSARAPTERWRSPARSWRAATTSGRSSAGAAAAAAGAGAR